MTQTLYTPKRCPNCNRPTKFNATGVGSPHFCPYCGWGVKKVNHAGILEEAEDPPLPKSILALAWIFVPIFLTALYYIIHALHPDISPSILNIAYILSVAAIITIGFFVSPSQINNSRARLGGYRLNIINVYTILIFIVIPGNMIATTLKSTYQYINKRSKSSQ
ncbi:zinc ribbon domain-containing protein [Planctomycetota bacterium]|nr:zinc ribbon domain-containing protein [Planctomycetota bacterium]